MSSANRNRKEKVFSISHRCFFFSRNVIGFVRSMDVDPLYRSIFMQLIRCSTSIGANVIEGKTGSSKKDWLHFYKIALKSSNETKYWLCLIRDSFNFDHDKIKSLLKEVLEISNIIAKIIVNAEKN